MSAQYENQGGLLVKPGTNECAGYLIHFREHGAYDPQGKVSTGEGPSEAEIHTHNAILAKAECAAYAKRGKGTFYLVNRKRTDQWGGRKEYRAEVKLFTEEWLAPWVYVEHFYAAAFGGGIDAFKVWFTGPDGKKWYGINKGNMDCFNARRLKNQK